MSGDFLPAEVQRMQKEVARLRQQRIRLGVAGIVRFGRDLLMVCRAKAPHIGKWVLPGGGINFGERWRTALVRELAEETGITVTEEDVLRICVVRDIIENGEHRLVLFADVKGPNEFAIRAGGDVSSACFITQSQLRALNVQCLLTPTTQSVLFELGIL